MTTVQALTISTVSGGTDAQWAENLSLLFTFRGIPCIYYGSEVGFRRGVRIDPGLTVLFQKLSRAYFGGYITGDVTATDFKVSIRLQVT